MELPPHPESDDETSAATSRKARSTAGETAVVVIAAALIGLVALMAILHLTGIIQPGPH